MTKPFSLAFKEKMVERLSGKDAVSAQRLSAEVGVPQGTLSRWLQDARNLPLMPTKKPSSRSIDEKVRILSEAQNLGGSELMKFLASEHVQLAELEQWRLALGEGGQKDSVTTKRIRSLERELARKEKALAEVAALLVLKKKVGHLWADEDDDIDGSSEK